MKATFLNDEWETTTPDTEASTTLKVTTSILFVLVIWLACICSIQSKKLDKVKGESIYNKH